MIRKVALLILALVSAVSLAAGPSSVKAVDRPIDAASQEALGKSLAELKKDLSSEDFQQLFSSISWIVFYEGTVVGVGGRYDPELGLRRACAVFNGKSARQVCDQAVRIAKDAPKVLEAYKRWLAAGSP